jgi:hypothetical protein
MALSQLLAMRSVAQLAPVVRIPSFFSCSDVATTLSLAAKYQEEFGSPPPARRGWSTSDLHEKLSTLPRHLDVSMFKEHGSSLASLSSALKIRCAELHVGKELGSLNDPKHFDAGSVVTVDIMLSDKFEGGDFQTLESDGTMKSYDFNVGDALIFPSYKYHSVAPISSGVRKVKR